MWLLPFYPSPRRDDGYDIADYRSGQSGITARMQGLSPLHAGSTARGICAFITELVINHTSDQHPWFQTGAARSRPDTDARNLYVWSDTDQRYAGTRVIFKDIESSNWTWDKVAGAYYWHRFFSHQPDLNYDNPAVRDAMLRVVDFWLDLGVDGLRLDAVPYLERTRGHQL